MHHTHHDKVFVGKRRVLIIRKDIKEKVKIQDVTQMVFPDYFSKYRFIRFFQKRNIKIHDHSKNLPSQFENTITIEEEYNDWEQYPFVSILFTDDGCSITKRICAS